MAELFHALGVDWKLLLAQGINFFVVLVVLTVFVYRPLLAVMAERRKKIEAGLRGADEAEEKLKEIELLKTKTLTDAEKEALALVSRAEDDAKSRKDAIVHAAEVKAAQVLKEAESISERRKKEELERLLGEASGIVRSAIAKTVELDPEKIDEALIRRATQAAKESLASS